MQAHIITPMIRAREADKRKLARYCFESLQEGQLDPPAKCSRHLVKIRAERARGLLPDRSLTRKRSTFAEDAPLRQDLRREIPVTLHVRRP